jgi:hypothetical protein
MPGVPDGLLRYLSRLLAAGRRFRGTPARSRKLTPRGQAVLALRWFRDRTRTGALGRDHGISRATAYRYVAEAAGVLSEQAPGLTEALERALAEGMAYVILDGKVFGTDACAGTAESAKGGEISLWYSGRKRRYAPASRPSCTPAGSRCGRARPSPARCPTPAPPAPAPCPPCTAPPPAACRPLADGGCQGAGTGIRTPVKSPRAKKGTAPREPGDSERTRNLLLRGLRCRGERGFALLTRRWAALQHVTASPSRITEITRAALVLTHWEHKYLKQIL